MSDHDRGFPQSEALPLLCDSWDPSWEELKVGVWPLSAHSSYTRWPMLGIGRDLHRVVKLALLHVASACRLSFPPAWRPQDIQTSSLATRGCTGEFSAEEVKSALSFFTQTWYSCGMAAAAFSLHSGSRTQVWIHEEENEGLPCSRGMAELWKNM